MTEISAAIIVLILLGLAFEYRIKQPDEWTLSERNGMIRRRQGRFYPRHLTLALNATHYSVSKDVSADAKGRLGLRVHYTLTVAPDPEHVNTLIQSGGWHKDAVKNASEELTTHLQSIIRQNCENLELEEMNSAKLSAVLNAYNDTFRTAYGLQTVTLNVNSIEASDKSLTENLQERETARIQRDTEAIRQEARIRKEEVRLNAEADILAKQHILDMQKQAIGKEMESIEAELAELRVRYENDRRTLQLEAEKAELAVKAEHPELLLTDPQLARLIEAGQSLRNAKTIISLGDATENSPAMAWLEKLVSRIFTQIQNKTDK